MSNSHANVDMDFYLYNGSSTCFAGSGCTVDTTGWTDEIGGLLGALYFNNFANISNSYFSGEIYADQSGVSGIGGLIGVNSGDGNNLFLSNSFSDGSIYASGGSNILGNPGGFGTPGYSSTHYYDRGGMGLFCENGADPSGCSSVGSSTYFRDYSNSPMSSWNFSTIWDPSGDGTSLPTLRD